jgi:hypothetical protein
MSRSSAGRDPLKASKARDGSPVGTNYSVLFGGFRWHRPKVQGQITKPGHTTFPVVSTDI